MSLGDAGWEISGRQISVSTYYCFLIISSVGLVCGGFFWFFVYFLPNIPKLLFYLIHTISRIFQRVSQAEGALSTIFIQLCLLKTIYLLFAPRGKN